MTSKRLFFHESKRCALLLASRDYPTGQQRTVLSLPDVVRLHDISTDGRVLLSHETWRLQMKGLFPGDTAEQPYSWLDSTNATAIADDGRSITFYEQGESYYVEHDQSTYYRRTDGSPAVQLGPGKATLSPEHVPVFDNAVVVCYT